jgi:hypothetical protein
VGNQIGPAFARSLFDAGTPNAEGRPGFKPFQAYLRGLQMTNNYHFLSNVPASNAVFIEVQLKDANGVTYQTLNFPDEKANFWVRHRQSVLVRGLSEDQPLPPQPIERIAPAGAGPVLVEFWEMAEPGVLRLSHKPANQVPTNQPVHRPSDAGKILAESYLRYLCRTHNAASAELIRHHRAPVMPALWVIPGNPPPDAFTEIKSHFGVYRREQ